MAKRRRKTIEYNGMIHTHRKVMKMGASLVISLPSGWVRKYGIKPGDEVSMTANDIVSIVKLPLEQN